MRRLQHRLIWWFVLGCLLPMLLVGYIAYQRFEQSYLQGTLNRLEALAADRAAELDSWVADQTDHIGILTANPAITDCALRLEQQLRRDGAASPAYAQAVSACQPALQLQGLQGLKDLLLIAADGRVVYSMQRKADFNHSLYAGALATTGLSRMARTLQGKSGLYFVPHEYYPPAGEQSAFWLAPLLHGGKMHGLLAIRLDNHAFDRIGRNFLGVGKSGEHMVVRAEKNGTALIMAPLRHVDQAAYRMQVSLAQQNGQPMWQVLSGQKGSGPGLDYRGVPVLAAWQPVNSLGWAVITKIDQSEALAPVVAHRNNMIMLLLAVSLVSSLIALWRGRKLVRPIRRLVEASHRLAQGDWHARLPPLGQTEFGALGRAFNAMADQIELSQRQSQLQLADAERMARLGYCISYSNGQPDEWSEQLYRILELPASQPADVRQLLARIHPDDLQRVLLAQAVGPQQSYEASYRLLLPDGKKKYIHEVGRHEADTEGQLLRRVAVVQDITAAELMAREMHAAQQALEQERLARAEQAASHAEAKAQAILQAMGEGVLGLAQDGRVVFCNQAAAVMLGSDTEALTGLVLDDFLQHYNSYGLRLAPPSPLLRALQQGMPCSNHQEQFGSSWRERFAVFYQLNMLPEQIGELCAVLLFRDISLQRANEMRLEQMSRAVTQSPAGVLITDPQGVIEYVNPRLLQMTGYQEQELLGQQPSMLRSGETNAAIYHDLWGALHAGQTWHGELLNLRKDGSQYWVMQMISPLRDGNGRLTHYVSVQEDITAQKQLAAHLQAALAEAESATAAKSAFLANMSHEIRTPMNAIIGMADLALNDELPVRARSFIGKVLRSARSLLGIINDILDFSKIESGQLQIEQAPFALEDVLAPLADMLAMRLDGRPVELLFDVAPDVPQRWEGDALRLGQVLLNLLGNAVKFTTTGSVVLRVRWDGSQLQFAVVDTGIGMSQEQQARLFVPFSQADVSTQRRYGGTGLGLVISSQLVQMMGGGNIAVHSEAGKGSTLTFALPLPPLPALPEGGAQPAGRVFHALLSPGYRDWLQAECHQRGVPCRDLSQQAQLLLQLAAWQPGDVLLLDSDHADWQQLLASQSWPAHARIVLLSRQHATVAELLPGARTSWPLCDVWVKPMTPGRLWQGVQQLAQVCAAISGQRQRAHVDLHGCKVLVVDDVSLNQEVAAAYLQQAGAEVSFAANGEEALQMLAQGLPDVVLMDCHMPVMDGFAATRAIRANPAWQGLKVVALTANALTGSREEVLAAGMDDYISKPLDPQQLFATLQRLGLRSAPLREPVASSAAATEARPDQDIWQVLRQAGVDVDGGIARAMQKPDIYRKWLLMFARNSADFRTQTDTALAAGDDALLLRLVHTVKGAAANVSAEAVVQQAEALEAVLHAPQDSGQRAAALIALQRELDAVQQAVAALERA